MSRVRELRAPLARSCATPRARSAVLAAAALLALLTLAGCATTAAPAAAPGVAPAGAPPELHFLVARGLELDGDAEQALEVYQRALAGDPDSTFLLRKVAELSARQNRLEDAITHAERAHALDPDDRGIRLFLGTLNRFRRDVEAAERVLRAADGNPIDADAGLLLYGVYTDADRLDDAERIARWLIEVEGDGLRGYFALADVMERRGDPLAAEQPLREALGRHPGDLSLYGALARARRDRGDHEGEVEVLHEILEAHPDHHATLLALADALLELERVDEAAEVLERVEASHPDDLRSILRLGFLEFERRNHAASAERFEHALSLNPEQHEVAYFLGIVRRRQRQLDPALEAFQRIPAGHERYPEARAQIAAIHESRGDYRRAIEEVELARERQPSRPLDLYLASLRSKQGDFDGALAFLERLLTSTPEDPELLYNLGVIHGEARQVEAALGYMQRVLEQDPDHAGALNYVGYTWAEQGHNLDQAEAYVTRALEIRPDDGYITDSLGWIYYMRARPLLEGGRHADGMRLLDRAVSELERANELTGGDPVISEHLGDAYLLMGERARALEMFREAVELGPRSGEQSGLAEKLRLLEQELGVR